MGDAHFEQFAELLEDPGHRATNPSPRHYLGAVSAVRSVLVLADYSVVPKVPFPIEWPRAWEDHGGKYSDICLLGIDDGKPFDKAALTLSETLGPISRCSLTSRPIESKCSVMASVYRKETPMPSEHGTSWC